jgi:predicted transcriptional regulator
MVCRSVRISCDWNTKLFNLKIIILCVILKIKKICFILFFLFILGGLSTIAYAQDGYTVKPHSSDNGTSLITNSTGFDFTTTFWNLPLEVKLLYFLTILVALLALLKLTPIVIGEVKRLRSNDNRIMIQSYIKNNPGATIRETARDQHLNFIIARHHINKLERAGLVVSRSAGKFSRVFPSSTYSDLEMKIIPYLKNETSRLLIMTIRDDPGVTNHEMAEKYNLRRSTVHWHMERFLKDDIVRAKRDGKEIKYYIKDDVEKALERLTKRGDDNTK